MKQLNKSIGREEKDTIGVVRVPIDAYWGAQTQRALQYFNIGRDLMPEEIIEAFGIVKMAAAIANQKLQKLSCAKAQLIITACQEVSAKKLTPHFPLKIWQSGSGTQTNMNCNEVIANRAIELGGGVLGSKNPIHPNDDVNMSQSTNDVFPTVMHIAAVKLLCCQLIPAVKKLRNKLAEKQQKFTNIIKIGRTHLQDAVLMTLGQEFSGYVAQLDAALININNVLPQLCQLAIGGTAVGTGLNAPPEFANIAIAEINKITKMNFVLAANKFSALAAHDAIVMASGALKTLGCALMKIANDIRWLSSGPCCGLGELILPANEPGSSSMPGKINPTQCEAMTMVCAQVMGNDVTISFAGSQGNFELNTFKPVIICNFIHSAKLLTDACTTFGNFLVQKLKADRKKIQFFVQSSLMVATALVPTIGYDKTAEIVQQALTNKSSLRTACLKLKYLSGAKFDELINFIL